MNFSMKRNVNISSHYIANWYLLIRVIRWSIIMYKQACYTVGCNIIKRSIELVLLIIWVIWYIYYYETPTDFKRLKNDIKWVLKMPWYQSSMKYLFLFPCHLKLNTALKWAPPHRYLIFNPFPSVTPACTPETLRQRLVFRMGFLNLSSLSYSYSMCIFCLCIIHWPI